MTLEALARQGNTSTYENLAARVSSRIHETRKAYLKECFSDFQSLGHRMESVATIHHMEFINDSRSTTLNATWYALESLHKPVVWITGGIDRGNDYTMIADLVRKKVRAIITLGPVHEKLTEAFGGLEIPIAGTAHMEEAVQAAYYFGKKGDAILLSPGCASFDRFNNYEERGHAFIRAVKNL